MKQHLIKIIPHHVISPLRNFFNDSRSSGIILIIATFCSLVLANIFPSYPSIWLKEPFYLHFISTGLPESNLLVINDFLMTFFFLLVAMEIKRELTIGELSSIKKSLMPIIAALGGMVVPALIYALFNANSPSSKGWGIPMATDIAFSLAALSVLGKKIPVQIKIFLTALAIIDDLGAIVTIACFYSQNINFIFLGVASLFFALTYFLGKNDKLPLFFFMIPAAIGWYCLFNSGIHATVTGVVVAFTLPLKRLAALEIKLIRPVQFFILPLFVIANTAIPISFSVGNIFNSPILYGVFLGLCLGKPLGIFSFCMAAHVSKIATLPKNMGKKELLGVGLLGGIGFTMSMFTTSLSFTSPLFDAISKVTILFASVLSAVLGIVYLKNFTKSSPEKTNSISPDHEKVLHEDSVYYHGNYQTV